jgi:mRNA-degrading endonuclease YafQ of YafQ-DinJ toxin-antitoxin module
VKRELIRSPTFVRAARKFVKKRPAAATDIRDALNLLAEDAFDHRQRTHKLKGPLSNRWACSAGYDLRIVFEFKEYEGAEAILLLTVGTHEEVY